METLLREKEKLDSLIKRKFTREITVLFTDICGSTRLAEELGDIAMRTLLKNHNDIIFPIVEAHRGVLVKTMGDGTLSYFEKAPDAVLAAVDIQKGFEKYNEKSAHPPIILRCGLNTGRGIVEKNDVYGDVVNTAQRFEAMAKPGEILISADTNKLSHEEKELKIVFSGETQVKGKAGMQKVYKVVWREESAEEQYKTSVKTAPPLPPATQVTTEMPLEWDGKRPTTSSITIGAGKEAKVIVAEEGKEPKEYDLNSAPVIIGRSTNANIHLDETYVSRKHARIIFENGKYYIEDLHSHIGTIHAGVKITRYEMRDKDEFIIGSVKLVFLQGAEKPAEKEQVFMDGEVTMELNVREILRLLVEGEGGVVAQYDLTPSPMVIGRIAEADIRLDNQIVSRKHARIFVKEGKAVIEDLKSNNGTYVNGQKIEKTEVAPGEEIGIGPFILRVVDPTKPTPKGEPSLVKKVFSFLKKT